MGSRRRRRRSGRRRSSSFPSHVAEEEDTDVQATNRPQVDSAVEHGTFFFRPHCTWRLHHPWIDPEEKIMVLHAIMYPQDNSSKISKVLSPGDFKKTIVRHGDGCYLPGKGTAVEVHLTATSSDGCQFASTRQGETPLIFVLGTGENLEVFNIARKIIKFP